jgi:isoleucyl-tRNA synthetase
LTLLLAPVIPFTAEESWQFLFDGKGNANAEGKLLRESVHLQQFPQLRDLGLPQNFSDRWAKILELRSKVNEHLEKARQSKEIGKSLEAQVSIGGSAFGPHEAELLADVLIVSKVQLEGEGDLAISVRRADGKKCVRCWKYYDELGKDPKHPELCSRCTQAVNS